MKLDFTHDSVFISYEPGKNRFAYSYKWKQDEERGLMECYREVALDSEKLGHEIITSQLYILHVSDDSISILIPKLKTRFDLGRVRK